MGNRPIDNDGPSKLYIPKDRISERTQGCWNCKHWSTEEARRKWSAKRQGNLEQALKISLESPQGQDDQRVYNIRGMVDRLDHEIAKGSAGVCSGGGKDPHGNPVGDFVVHNYLCSKWSGAQGASMARGAQKADKLPEELQEQLDGPRPYPINSRPTLANTSLGGSLVKKGVT